MSTDEIKAQEEKDKQELDDYIIKLLKIDFVDARIRKQINKYVRTHNVYGPHEPCNINLRALSNYMKENNLYIVSSNYLLNTAVDYDDCMRILIFEKLPENTD